jgi:hypothetical protein
MHPNIGPFEILVPLVIAITVIWPTCRVCEKAGFPGALGLLIVIPVLNLFLLYFLAFAEWPSLRPKNAKSTLEFLIPDADDKESLPSAHSSSGQAHGGL